MAGQYGKYSGAGGGGGSGGVTSLNTLTGAVTLAAGSGITITPAGNTLTIAATNTGSVTSVTASSPLASSGGATPNITIQVANGSQNGYLSSTDWTTFNSKGSGTVTAISIASTNGFAGSSSGGATPILTISTSITGVLKGNGTAISTAVAGTDYVIPSGNITGSAGSISGTNVITNANRTQMASLTIKGNNTGGTANEADLTVAQVNAILPVFTSTLNGLAPLSGGGTTNYLRADGTWATPPGGGGFTNPMTTLGDIIYENATPAPARLAGNTTATKNFLVQTGTGSVSAAPVWGTIAAADVPTLNQNTTGTASNITATSNSTLTTLSSLSLPGSQVTGNISGNAANVTGVVAIANGGTGSATQNFVDLTTAQTVGGIKTLSVPPVFTQSTTPANPAASSDKLYFKSDDALYSLSSAGVETKYTSAITTYAWSGFHQTASSNAAVWVTGSTTYGDLVPDSSDVSLTQVNNVNFGTVTGYVASSGPTALPGIVFTPPVAGLYYIKASSSANVGQSTQFRLWDGTTVIDSTPYMGITTGNNFPFTLSGLLNISSLSSKTISIQGAQATSSGGLTSTIISGQRCIDWTIFYIGPSSAATQLTPAQVLQFTGDGSDGALTISSGTTVASTDKNYTNITITGTGKLSTAGYRIKFNGTLDLTSAPASAISGAGTNGSASTLTSAGVAGTASSAGTLGTNGAGSAGIAATTAAGAQATAATAVAASMGSSFAAGTCGAGGAGTNAGGITRAGTAPTLAFSLHTWTDQMLRGVTLAQGGTGGPGGSSGGGDGTNAGGGGGGGGAGGNIVWLSGNTINRNGSTVAAAITAAGGPGGNGGNGSATGTTGGGGGGSGGCGGLVYLAYITLAGSAATGTIAADGGAGGTGGTGSSHGGNGGGSGASGRIATINLTTGTYTESVGVVGVAGSASVGTAGGVAAATNTLRTNL